MFSADRGEKIGKRMAPTDHVVVLPAMEAKFLSPSAQGLAASIMLQDHCRSAVALLSGQRYPSAVCSVVIAIAIDSVERIARWTFAHVGKKRGRVVSPTLAHNDPTATVIRVPLVARIVAATLSSRPRDVFTRFRGTMRNETLAEHIGVQASTTARVTTDEITRTNLADVTTSTVTLPNYARMSRAANITNSGQSTEVSVRKIHRFHVVDYTKKYGQIKTSAAVQLSGRIYYTIY